MYIKKNISILSVIKSAWKVQLLILITVVVSTIAFQEFLKQYFEVSRTIIAVLGTALAFFIGFINNQAYERWWEARKVWGMIANDSWSLSRMVGSFIENQDLRKEIINRHLAFLYALIDNLREQNNQFYIKFLSAEDISEIKNKKNTPVALLNIQGKTIDKAQRESNLEIFRMVQLNEILNRFSDSMGMAIRIKTTVFPPFYKALISTSIWVFIIIFPMVLSERIGYWSILYSFILGSIFDLVYLVGQALIDPFEKTVADTPMSTITRNLEIDLLQELGEKDIPEPLIPIDGSYYL